MRCHAYLLHLAILSLVGMGLLSIPRSGVRCLRNYHSTKLNYPCTAGKVRSSIGSRAISMHGNTVSNMCHSLTQSFIPCRLTSSNRYEFPKRQYGKNGRPPQECKAAATLPQSFKDDVVVYSKEELQAIFDPVECGTGYSPYPRRRPRITCCNFHLPYFCFCFCAWKLTKGQMPAGDERGCVASKA